MEFANINDQELKTLACTLKNNGLAASETEAIRMAQQMMGTQKKVQTDFEEKKEELTIDPWDRARKEREKAKQREIEMKTLREKEVENYKNAQPDPSAVHLESTGMNEIQKANIELMRQAAVESKPIEVQTHYDTPENDQKTLNETVVIDDEQQPGPSPPDTEGPEPDEEPINPNPDTPPIEPTPEPLQPGPEPDEPEQPEEDIPETTREIPAKPSVVRPRESFVESQIDLSDVFNFGRR